MKKKIFTLLLSASMVFSLSGCAQSDEIDALQEENSLLKIENLELEDGIQDLSDALDTLMDEINAQNDIISNLIASVNNLLTEMENNDAAIQANFDALILLIDDLTNTIEEKDLVLDATISDLLESIQGLKYSITQMAVENYIEKNEFSKEYSNFFIDKTRPFLHTANNIEEIVEMFEEHYLVSGLEAENDNLSTESSLSIFEPAAQEYDHVDLHFYYRDKLIHTVKAYESADFDFAFAFPNYGKYTLKTYAWYDTLMISKELNFGVTSNHYRFAILNGTFPVLLFAAEHMAVTNPTYPTFISLGRPSTYKWDYLPENTHRFPDFIRSAGDYRYESVYELGEWVNELLLLNPTSTFELDVVDNYIGIAIAAFDRLEVPTKNYTVNIWTDGTFTSKALNTYGTMSNLNTRSTTIQNYRKSVKNIGIEEFNYALVSGNVQNSALAYAYSMSNVNYYVNTLTGLKMADQDVVDAINNTLTLKTVPALFDNLRDSGNMTAFEYLLGTRWGEGEDEGLGYHFNSPKQQYILILGTSTAGENPTATNKYYAFNDYIDQLITKYGDEYEIFYKGHPAYPSSPERKQMFNQHNIVELNNTIPVEIMMYIYPNVYVGGYRGSSFLSSLPGQTANVNRNVGHPAN